MPKIYGYRRMTEQEINEEYRQLGEGMRKYGMRITVPRPPASTKPKKPVHQKTEKPSK